MATTAYVIYGVTVRSSRPIPRVSPSLPASQVDLEVRLGEMPPLLHDMQERAQHWHSSPHRDERGEPGFVLWKLECGAFYRLRYVDGIEFVFDRLGTRLWATWPEDATAEDMAAYLLGPVLGLILRLRGTHTLHASAIAAGNGAIALVGESGAGKSTAAAAFAQLGYRILSDDLVAIKHERGDFMVQPAYPCVRLWPESAEALFGASVTLPRFTPTWDKRYLDLAADGDRFQREPLPLAAIYFLGDRSAGPDAPKVEAISPGAAMVELIASITTCYLEGATARAEEFEIVRTLVAGVPLRRVIASTRLADLPRLCDVILEDFRAITRPAGAGPAARQAAFA